MFSLQVSSQSTRRKQDRTTKLRIEKLEDRKLLAAHATPIEPAFKLVPDDIAAGDNVGFAVAIDGNTAVVGSGYDAGPSGEEKVGAAYVFVRHGQEWVQEAKLTPSADDARRFGNGVAVSGDTILVGAPGLYDPSIPFPDPPFDRPGSAYIFKKSKSGWTEETILRPDGQDSNDFFGAFVDLDNNTAIVSALAEDSGGGFLSGNAYAFGRQGNEWTQTANFAEFFRMTIKLSFSIFLGLG